MALKFYLRDKQDETLIILTYIFSRGNILKYSTGITIARNAWLSKSQRATSVYKDINQTLSNYDSYVNKVKLNCQSKGLAFTKEYLREQLQAFEGKIPDRDNSKLLV